MSLGLRLLRVSSVTWCDAEVIPDDDDDDDPDTYEEGDDELVAQVERLRAEAGMSS